MTIEERVSGGAMVLDVEGRMTIETLGEIPLAVTVRRLLQDGRKDLVLNLKGVPRLDTTGLCALVEAYVTLRRQGGSLKLLHLTPHVREVLRVTRLLTILEAYESEAEAVASFGSAIS
jgi:anti-sigma B factor antagonist